MTKYAIVENGCKLHPDCFTCPFPDDCHYGETKSKIRDRRNEEIQAERKAGMGIVDLARKYKVSRKIIDRVLRC